MTPPAPTAPSLARVLPEWLALRLWRASQTGGPGSLIRLVAIEREVERIRREYPHFFR